MSQFLAVIVGRQGGLAPPPVDLSDALNGWPGVFDVETTPGAALGMSMVAADSSRGHDKQPRADSLTQVAVVADCRLDNRVALCSILGLDKDSIDSEILLRGYESWGFDLPSHLVGDFSCAIWDWRNERVVAFRDPLGVKPLFYAQGAGTLVVASDVELILKIGRPRVLLDDHFIVEHLLWQYVSANRSFWQDIRRLPGGHVLSGEWRSPVARRYWFPERRQVKFSSESEVAETFAQLFRQSVARRLDTDGPVFAHLSGGLDSSSIVCMAREICRDESPGRTRLYALSQRFPGMSCDEGPYIQAVLDWTGIEGVAWDDPSPRVLDFEQPNLTGPGTMTYQTSGSSGDLEIAAQSGGRVVLSGFGGDQLGSSSEVVEDMIERQPLTFALETIGLASLTMPQRRLRARLMLKSFVPRGLRAVWGTYRHRRELPRWVQPRWRELAGEIAEDLYEDTDVHYPDAIRRARWKDLTSGRIGVGLDLNQKGAALRGIEMRFPFLDQDLVAGVLSVPTEFWPRPSANARIHRRALSDILPPTVSSRRTKALFAEPMARLMLSQKRTLRRLFWHGEWFAEPYVDRSEARLLLDKALFEPRVSEWSVWRGVWAIATLEAWLRAIFGYAWRARSDHE